MSIAVHPPAGDPELQDRIVVGGSGVRRTENDDYNAALFSAEVRKTAGVWRFELGGHLNEDEGLPPSWVGSGVHADVHDLSWIPGPAGTPQLWVACDGGVFRSRPSAAPGRFTAGFDPRQQWPGDASRRSTSPSTRRPTPSCSSAPRTTGSSVRSAPGRGCPRARRRWRRRHRPPRPAADARPVHRGPLVRLDQRRGAHALPRPVVDRRRRVRATSARRRTGRSPRRRTTGRRSTAIAPSSRPTASRRWRSAPTASGSPPTGASTG